MKIRSAIRVDSGIQGEHQITVDGDFELLSVSHVWVNKHSAKNICIGDYIDPGDGLLQRVTKVNHVEYDESETNPDHAIRDSLPESEAAVT